MQCYQSTRGHEQQLGFDDAIFRGLAPDGGLYLAEPMPAFDEHLSEKILSLKNYPAVAELMLSPFLKGSIAESGLGDLLEDAFNFEVPLIELDAKKGLYVLELFHGPTLAFKDVGARFMARVFSKVIAQRNERILILAATSGDTGSAVANGFLNVPNIDVCILYPKGKVSKLQEQQITTNGANIKAIEVEGSFDDCQALVKQALSQFKSAAGVHLSTANSINISRLLPQSTYYAWAFKQLGEAAHYVVPSGNFGNISSGLIASKMGLPNKGFTAAVNANRVFPEYLETGIYKPKASVSTPSNAMDVGAPSNFERVTALFNQEYALIKKGMISRSVSDQATISAIKEVFDHYGYIVCPHTATAYVNAIQNGFKAPQILLATAHPAKFGETVNEVIGKEVEIPERLAACMRKEKQAISMAASYEEFEGILNQYA